MSQGSNKTTTTQTRNVAPPSAQEGLLQASNEKAALAQSDYLQRAMQQQQAYESSPLFTQLQGLTGQAATGLQNQMGGQLLMPGQQNALQQYYQQSIIDPAMNQMQQRAQQEAARRGMTIADSPIGQPFLNEMANYRSQIGGQQAGSALQLSNQNQNMYQGLLNFGQGLQQNATNNRLQLAQAQPGSYSFGNQLAQNRIQSAPVSITQRGMTQQPFGQQFGQYAQGIGSAIGAAQGGLNLYNGVDPKYGSPGIKDLWK